MAENLTFGLIGQQDLNLGKGTFVPTLPDGTTPTFDKIGIHTLLGTAYLSAADFSGADASIKIAAAIADLPAIGGVIDARMLTGSQTWSTNPFASVTKPITLLLGDSTIIVTTSAIYNSTGNVAGVRIIGSGMLRTIIDNRVANGSAFRLASTTANTFQFGSIIKDLSIITNSSQATSSGIYLVGVYQPLIENVWIGGLSGDGIRIAVSGDTDGPNQVIIRRCWITGNTGVGIDCENSASGIENSFLQIDSTFVTLNVAGGLRLRGINSFIKSSAFTLNTGFGGLHIPMVADSGGASVNGRVLTVQGSVFEHNGPIHVHIETLGQGLFENCEFVSNAPSGSIPRITDVVKLNPTGAGAVLNVKFTNSFVRVNAGQDGSPTQTGVIAFNIATSACQNITIEGTRWDVFGGQYQVRYADSGINTVTNEENILYSPMASSISAIRTNTAANRNFTADAATDTLTTAATHNLQQDEIIRLVTTGTLPTGLAAATNYWVHNPTSLTFQLRASATARLPIDITGAGAGTHSIENSYVPNVDRWVNHRVTLAGTAAAFTIQNPNNLSATAIAREFILYLRNTTAGTVTLTFGAELDSNGISDPLTTEYRVLRFIHEADATPQWKQQGLPRNNKPNFDALTIGGQTNSRMTFIGSVSGTMDWGSIAAHTAQDSNSFLVPGALTATDIAVVSPLSYPVNTELGMIYTAFVAADGVVRVRASNITAGPIDPATRDFRIVVFRCSP